MAEEVEKPEEAPEVVTPDYSWAPESFVKDGALDTDGFRARYDELAAFKAQDDERLASLPTDPAQYELRVPEFELPEGVELPVDENGQPVKFELDADDPELPALRTLAMDLKLDQAGMDKILSLYAVREARAQHERNKVAGEEMKKLGPDAKSRMDEIKRQLGARLPEGMAKELSDSIASADALRGLEKLMSAGTRSTVTPSAKPDLSTLSPLEKLTLGSQQKQSA